MADMTMDHPGGATTDSAGTGRRWPAAWPGVAFVVLFVVAVLNYNIPNDDDPDKTWVNFFATRGNRVQVLLTGFMLVFAALVLLVFILRVYERVVASGATRDPLPLMFGGVSSALIAAGGLVGATVSGSTIFGQVPVPTNADLLRYSTELLFPLVFLGGMFPLAVFMVLVTWRAQRSGYFGTAMTVFSYVAAAAAVASVMFFPIAVVLIWMLAVSVVLVRRPAVR